MNQGDLFVNKHDANAIKQFAGLVQEIRRNALGALVAVDYMHTDKDTKTILDQGYYTALITLGGLSDDDRMYIRDLMKAIALINRADIQITLEFSDLSEYLDRVLGIRKCIQGATRVLLPT